jgi:putative sigma-54 modulation protein
MKLTLFFKNIKHTPALDSRIEEKSQHFAKYFDGMFEVQWYCYAKTGTHVTNICLIGSGYRCRASATSDNLYKSFDLVLDKMMRQLQKRKEKFRDRIHRGTSRKSQLLYLFKDEGNIRRTKEDKAS